MKKTLTEFEVFPENNRKQYITDTVLLVIITILICTLIVIVVGAV